MAEKEPVIRIAGISGSLRAGSYTHSAVAAALEGAAESGAETRLIDLREYQLVFLDGRNDADYPADVLRLRADVKQADGLILGTPEYHGGLSGVLKNALDLMGFDEFEGKMIALVGVSGGRLGAYDALNTLRNVGRALHAWVIPDQASIPEAWKVFGAGGEVMDAQHAERLKDVGRQLGRFTRLHKCESAIDFVKNWQKAQANPGG